MAEIGTRLRWVREVLELTQKQMADHVGIHQTSWSLYERGERLPDAFEIPRIAGKLKITVNYLMGGGLDGVDANLTSLLVKHHPELEESVRKALRKDMGLF